MLLLYEYFKKSKFIDRESKLKTRARLHCDTNRFLQCLVIWTTKYRFSRSSNDSERCCDNHYEYAWVNHDRITQRAKELHFLHVKARIEFKILCLLAIKSLISGEPRYVKNLLQPISISSLGSSTSNRLVELFSSMQMFIERSFWHCTPRLYNQLPFELRTIDELSTFKKNSELILTKKLLIWKI